MRKEVIRENDYEQKERPNSRKAQFFDIFRHRFVEVLKISILQAVFNLPLIAVMVLFWLFTLSATNLNSLMTVFLFSALGLFISIISIFIGMTGSFYCFKKIIYAEGEYASTSFFTGLISEWKKGALVGLIAGLSVAITLIGSFFCYYYLSSYNSAVAGFGIAILVTQSLVVLIISYYSVAQLVIYENSFKAILKNSFIFALMRFQYNLPIFIIHPGILIALMVIMQLTMYIGIVLLFLFAAFGHLLWMLNALSGFDKFINKDNYPDYYRKGLRKEA